jgi:hypothetical protein
MRSRSSRVPPNARDDARLVFSVPFDSPLVGIEPFDATAHPTFAAVLERLQSTMRFSASGAYAMTHMTVSSDVRWALATDMVRFDSDLMRLDNFR